MTREEREQAISEFNSFKEHCYNHGYLPSSWSIEMAIKALSQEPCDDAISRILKRMWNCRGKHTTSIDKVAMEQIIRDELSVTQKSGKWVLNVHDIPICSQCGYMTPYDRAIDDYEYGNYCPKCGAKMIDPQESEDKE